MIYGVLGRTALATAFVSSFYVAPAWLCLAFWYGATVVVGTVLFLKRVKENENPKMQAQRGVAVHQSGSPCDRSACVPPARLDAAIMKVGPIGDDVPA
jgi:hypothetical protein